MSAYPRVLLGEVCTINPRIKRSGIPEEDTLVSFVPMAAVDERSGMITAREDRRLGDVSKGFTAFEDGDVLFAKITPCMENGKAALARHLTNGIGRGSTEFYVLRPGGEILGEYVYHFVRQPRFREKAKRHFTGTAGQQRVPKSFMENVPMPLPTLDEQRRIVSILNRAARIEHLRSQANRHLREFASALFIKMFGDPVENPMAWSSCKMGNLGTLDRGRSKHRPRNAPHLYGGSYPFIQTGDIATSGRFITEYTQTYSEAGLDQSRIWPAGTLCITIAANIGMTGVLDFDACFPDSVVGFLPNNQVTVEYVQTGLDLMQNKIEEQAPQSAQRNINLKILRELEIPVAPFHLQCLFAKCVTKVRDTVAAAEDTSKTASALSISLMTRLLGDFL